VMIMLGNMVHSCLLPAGWAC